MRACPALVERKIVLMTIPVYCDICEKKIEGFRTVIEGRSKYMYCESCFSALEKIMLAHHWPMHKDGAAIVIHGANERNSLYRARSPETGSDIRGASGCGSTVLSTSALENQAPPPMIHLGNKLD